MCGGVSDSCVSSHALDSTPQLQSWSLRVLRTGLIPEATAESPANVFNLQSLSLLEAQEQFERVALSGSRWMKGTSEAPNRDSPVLRSQVEGNDMSLNYSAIVHVVSYKIQMGRFGMKPALSPEYAELA